MIELLVYETTDESTQRLISGLLLVSIVFLICCGIYDWIFGK